MIFSSKYAFLLKFWIYLEYFPRAYALNYKPSALSLYEVPATLKTDILSILLLL